MEGVIILKLKELPEFRVTGNETQEEYLERKRILDEKASKHLPNDKCKIATHDATLDQEPTFITYINEYGNEVYMTTPEGFKQQSLRRLAESGLGSVVERYTFDNYECTEAYQQKIKAMAQKYLTDYKGKWFAMLGQSGIGKSHICSAIAIELIMKGLDVEYISWVDKLNEVRYDLDYYESFVRRMKSCPILYIDDLFKTGRGTDKLSDFEIRTAFEILNHRYVRRMTTILSTEVTVEEFFTLNEAVLGRIKEMSEGYFLDLVRKEGRNYRFKKK